MQAPASKRRYRLSDRGREALRASVIKNQPWRQSTGPTTVAGKARSCRNALKHGERSAWRVQQRGQIAELLALVRGLG